MNKTFIQPFFLLCFLILFFFTGSSLFSQRQQFQASLQQKNTKVAQAPPLTASEQFGASGIPSAEPVTPIVPSGAAKTTTVSPVYLSSSSNIFSMLRNEQNLVAASDSLKVLSFIHRQDVTIWGGGGIASGYLRQDVSADLGFVWNSDRGPLNPVYTKQAQFPEHVIIPDSGSTSPYDAHLLYAATTVNALPDYDGFVSGVSTLTGSVVSTENYLVDTVISLGTLTRGLPGEYWKAGVSYVGGSAGPFIMVYKGIYHSTTADVSWSKDTILVPDMSLTFDTTWHLTAPAIAFSPDGMTGWISFLGDLTGGPDSVFSPVLYKSTDGGANWESPVEVDLRTIPWISDTLKSLWVDSLGIPVSGGRPTTAYEHDLTVDMYGNPHLFTTIGSATVKDSLPGYLFLAGITKFAADVTSTDGGITWDVHYVAPVLTLRGEFGGASGSTPITMDNHPQISRTEDGTYIFYSWMDSDTNIIGFGESENIAPNIMISGFRVTDGFRTCYHSVTGGTVWEGRGLFSSMAPSVLSVIISGTDGFSLPIVAGSFTIPGDELQPFEFWYYGLDATFRISDFYPASSLSLGWGSCGLYAGGTPSSPLYNIVRGNVFWDINGNGVKELSEPNAGGVMIGDATAGLYAVTSYVGQYNLTLPAGSYNVTYSPGLPATVTKPAAGSYSLVFPSTGADTSGFDIGIFPTSTITDLKLSLASTSFKPGMFASVAANVSNAGSVVDSGSLSIIHDSLLTLLATSPPYTTYNSVTREITFDVAALPPFTSYGFNAYMDFSVSTTAVLGTPVVITGEISTPGADVDLTNNVDTILSVIVAAIDPNDKMVNPEGVIESSERLEYTIRFQNTGTDTAFAVTIRDTLDTDLDLKTLKILGFSHPYLVSLSGGNKLEFTFPGIELPDSNVNEPESHGFIQYEIYAQPGLPGFTEITNEAAIYFGFNPPVVTNTTVNTIDTVTYVSHPGADWDLIVFPNPFSENVNFRITGYDGQPFDFRLVTVTGQVVKTLEGISAREFVMDRGTLPAGMYLFELTRGERTYSLGKLVVR